MPASSKAKRRLTSSSRAPEPWLTERSLASGLRVQALRVPWAHRAVLSVHLHVGPRFETPANNGWGHFLEHMLYRGTKSWPSAHALALALETLGGSLEAMTYADHGSMSLVIPPANLLPVVPLFAEVLTQPVFSEVEVERNIVREELNEDLDELGGQIEPGNRLRALAFEGHGLGLPITGTPETLTTFTRAGLKRRHQRHYTASNMVLTLVSPEKPDRALRQLETELQLPRGKPVSSKRVPEQREARFSFTHHACSQTAVRVGFRAPGATHGTEAATQLLLRVLDDGMSTRLYARICDELGLCYDVSAEYEAYQDAGLVELAAEAEHSKAERLLVELLTLVSRLRDEGPSPAELDKVRARHGWQLSELLDSPEDLADFYGGGQLLQSGITRVARHEQLMAVTAQELRSTAAEIFCPRNLSVAVVGVQPARARRRLERLVRGFM